MARTSRSQPGPYPAHTLAGAPRPRLQDILLARGTVTPDDMFRALALQQLENARLGELVQGLGLASEAAVLAAQAEQAALPIVNFDDEPPQALLRPLLDPAAAVRLRCVPWRTVDDALVVAISDPEDVPAAEAYLTQHLPAVHFVLATRTQVQAALQAAYGAALSDLANRRTALAFSCRVWQGWWPRAAGVALAGGFAAAAVLAPQGLAVAAAWVVLATLILNGGVKLVALVAALWAPPRPEMTRRPSRLPKVSIMVPLLRERDILDRLIARMERLVYPRELLEICLVHEAGDTETGEHLATRALPPWMRTLEVPRDRLQTKPRALNYALDFLHGEVIGIYDAEDAPENDQIFRVLRRFASGGPRVAAVQCALDYYNARTNWLARCFTIEYATLFRIILPGFERLGLPIPLGGTSVFLRRDVLEELGRWDAQNVTEDADLGFRLHRAGYRCLVTGATTFEEANYRLLPWVRQRSRWLKGFLLTWITHSRRPVALVRELGFAGALVFHAMMMGTVLSFLAAPIVLPMWLLSFGWNVAAYEALPMGLFWALVAGFIATELFLIMLGAAAVARRRADGLLPYLALMPFYWPIGAVAAAKALWELFAQPSYWDKTAHGINDAEFSAEIDTLTRGRGNAASGEKKV